MSLNINHKSLVSVIVVNYNGGILLEKCVESIFKSDYTRFEVIVVDNASTDGSIERITERFPVILIKNKDNLGYSIAGNQGFKRAIGEYCFLLNNDVMLYRTCIDKLVKYAEKTCEAGLFQPKILFKSPRNILNSSGNMIHFTGFGICRGIGKNDEGQYDDSHEIGYASGASLFIRKQVVEEIGLFDPTFFAFSEDTDLGWRVMLCGWRVHYVPSAVCYHDYGASWGKNIPPLKFYLLERNRLYMILKNYSIHSLFLILPALIVVETSILLYALFKGVVGMKIKGYSDILRLGKKLKEHRHEIQDRRVTQDIIIFLNMEYEIVHSFLPKTIKVLNRMLSVFWKFSIGRMIRHRN